MGNFSQVVKWPTSVGLDDEWHKHFCFRLAHEQFNISEEHFYVLWFAFGGDWREVVQFILDHSQFLKGKYCFTTLSGSEVMQEWLRLHQPEPKGSDGRSTDPPQTSEPEGAGKQE